MPAAPTFKTATDAQRKAGNYKRPRRFRWNGLEIVIETPKGYRRRPGWPVMACDYGDIKRTTGADGDAVDVFVGPDLASDLVVVIDQTTAAGRFDEHKVIIGVRNEAQARAIYSRCYSKGWKVGPVTSMTVAQFRAWLDRGRTGRPVYRQVSPYAAGELPRFEEMVAYYDTQLGLWDEEAHPREEAGTSKGGQFTTKKSTHTSSAKADLARQASEAKAAKLPPIVVKDGESTDSKRDATTGKKLGDLGRVDLPMLNTKPACSGKVCDPPDASSGNAVELLPMEQYDKVLVQFSGGKDSLAALLDVLDSGVPKEKIELWHQKIDGEGRRFMDWPVTEDYCRKVAEHFGLPIRFQWKEGGFEGELTRRDESTKGVHYEDEAGERVYLPPAGKSKGTRGKWPAQSANLSTRWCSSYLKIDVAARAIRNDKRFKDSKTLFVSGERAEEGGNRENYLEAEKHRTHLDSGRLVHHSRPVHKWSERQVWDRIKKAGINPHPAYRLGYGRLSCQHCIFADAGQVASNRELDPEGFAQIAKMEKQLGHTISSKKRKGKTVAIPIEEKAAAGTSYITDAPEELKRSAMSTSYDLPVTASSWEYPAGAFKKSGGPGSLIDKYTADRPTRHDASLFASIINDHNQAGPEQAGPSLAEMVDHYAARYRDSPGQMRLWHEEDHPRDAAGKFAEKESRTPPKSEPVPSAIHQYPETIKVRGRTVDRPPIYLTGKSNKDTRAAGREMRNFGVLITPATKQYRNHLDDYTFYGVDNGVFGGKYEETSFYRMLEDLADIGVADKALFVAAPDSFDRSSMRGDWGKTLELAKEHLPRIRALGFPAAIVLQDGATVDTVPWDDVDALFVGGSDDFKLATTPDGRLDRASLLPIVKEAKRRNVPIHFGRVNSAKRIDTAHFGLEATSMDGTYIKFGQPGEMTDKVKAWLRPWGRFPGKKGADHRTGRLTRYQRNQVDKRRQDLETSAREATNKAMKSRLPAGGLVKATAAVQKAFENHLRREMDKRAPELARMERKYIRQNQLTPPETAQRYSTFAEAAARYEARWVTIGADKSNPPGDQGGTPVQISGSGEILKGPPSLEGQDVGNIKPPPRRPAFTAGERKKLSALQKRHAAGEIDKKTYWEQRAELVGTKEAEMKAHDKAEREAERQRHLTAAEAGAHKGKKPHELTSAQYAAQQFVQTRAEIERDLKTWGPDLARYAELMDSGQYDEADRLMGELENRRGFSAMQRRARKNLQNVYPPGIRGYERAWREQLAREEFWLGAKTIEHSELVEKAAKAGKPLPTEVAAEYRYSDWATDDMKARAKVAGHESYWKDQRNTDSYRAEARSGRQLRNTARAAVDFLRRDALEGPELAELQKKHDAAEAEGLAAEKALDAAKEAAGGKWDHPEVEKAMEHLTEVMERQWEASSDLSSAQYERTLAFLKNVVSSTDGGSGRLDYKIENRDKLPADMPDKVAQAVRFIESVLGERVPVDQVKIRPASTDNDYGKTGRSYANGTKVYLTEHASVATIVHEIGHAIEHSADGAIGKKSRQYLAAVTTGMDPKHLTKEGEKGKYRHDEIGIKDGFERAYAGKFYGGDRSTEVLSIGLESLYKNAAEFAKTSPDHFNYTLATIRGLI